MLACMLDDFSVNGFETLTDVKRQIRFAAIIARRFATPMEALTTFR